MKKFLVGALVGAILVFGWQSIAHMFMHHHDAAYMAVPDQDNVINVLSGYFKDEGQYLVPQAGMNVSEEDRQAFDDKIKGKPWALVTYHPAYSNDMGMAAIRSFTTAFLSVLIVIWLLGKNPGSFSEIFMKGLGIGVLMFIFVWYNSNIWLQTPWSVIKGELIDLLVAWGLCGLWLGWWLNRRNTRTSY